MVAPVSDLGITTISRNDGAGNYTLYDSVHRYKQVKPFSLVLPYYHFIGRTNYAIVGGGLGSQGWGANAFPPYWSPNYTNVRNLSYEKLRGALYSQAALGVNFVECNQSISMITSSLASLSKAALSVRRMDFVSAARELRMKVLPPRVSRKKSFANNWLEFHFGWQPLISDIYDAAEVLNNPVKSFTIEKATSREYVLVPPTIYDNYVAWNKFYSINAVVMCKQGARVRAITNAGLHSLEQWGLINPASLAWEVVPFSFVVDWFVNVGDFLRSFSDFAGMTLDSSFATNYSRSQTMGWYVHKPPYTSYAPRSWRVDYVVTERTTSLSGVVLDVKKVKFPSLSRAVTAASLLTQVLGKK